MPHPTIILNIVALTRRHLDARAPNLRRFAETRPTRTVIPVLPAVTCSVQSSIVTGAPVREHGIVGNGWFNHASCDVEFWKQSNRLVEGPKVWETARERDPSVTCANMFWWYNMYSSVDVSVTPRPMYTADGRKIPDVYTEPASLRSELQDALGTFPLFEFWGPLTSVRSSRWIAEATKRVWEAHRPTLTLVYLPHLDYDLQKYGPADPRVDAAVTDIDAIVGDLLAFFEERGVRVIVLSEYGIVPVTGAVAVNRVLREAGALRVRDEVGGERLDAAASDAVAVADHQVAHVYVKDQAQVERYGALLTATPGIDLVLDRAAQAAYAVDHPRAGDLVLVADRDRWFTYDYWLDDKNAPDFARTVDIHRKPGYDPRELFLDPALAAPRLRVGLKLLARRMGFRTLLDVTPLDTSLVRGSHGRVDNEEIDQPVLMADAALVDDGAIAAAAIHDVILRSLFEEL